VKNITATQSYVAEFNLNDYPITEGRSCREATRPGTPPSTP
jgi:hypothetical protein